MGFSIKQPSGWISNLLPLLLLLVPTTPVSGFYLPGVAPTNYAYSAAVPLHVNRLTPSLSKKDKHLRSLLSYDFYHPAFHFCQPKDGPRDVQESLGSILFGDRILTSAFDIRMAKNETCKVLCTDVIYRPEDAVFVNRKIEKNYNFNWLVDGLPAATVGDDPNDPSGQVYSVGFPLGQLLEKDGEIWPMLNNHYDIFIDYHQVAGGAGVSGVGADGTDARYRVVGVEIQPKSIHPIITTPANGDTPAVADCDSEKSPQHLNTEPSALNPPVTFTYSVYWRKSATPWATRWDKYLHVRDTHIHWFFLANSTVVVFFLTGMVGVILLRALRKDIARYNQLDLTEDVQEDSGWKLVHGDVFRSPRYPMLLSVFLGSGAQLFFMTGSTIFFALLGFLSPSNRGSLGTFMIILYTLFGFIGGYVSARMYKYWGGEAWKRNIVLTPLLVPAIVFIEFILINFFLVYEHSSGAVPFSTMLLLVGIWFMISVPLSFTGSWFGFKAQAFSNPVRTNQIPRQIPPGGGIWGGDGGWLGGKWAGILAGGVLPFGAVTMELNLILNSIWFHRVYYMFGFLFICYGIMITTTSAVTVLLIYWLLCSENYHWHWRAFMTAGSTALYIIIYALFYWAKYLRMGGWASNVVYLGYSGVIAFLMFILTGTIGYFASWAFVRRIYSSIKID